MFGCAAVVNVPVKKLAVTKLPPATLPNVPLPVALTIPPVIMLPPSILPVAVIRPPVPKLPTLALPVAFSVPTMLAPVPVTTSMFALPATSKLMFPFLVGEQLPILRSYRYRIR